MSEIVHDAKNTAKNDLKSLIDNELTSLTTTSSPSEEPDTLPRTSATLDKLDLVFKKTDDQRTLIHSMRVLRKLEMEHNRRLPDKEGGGNSFQGAGKDMGRHAARIVVEGDIMGEGAQDTIGELRKKYLKGEPLEFVSQVTLESGINKVMIEELAISSVKGSPHHFQYGLRLVEYVGD